MDHTTVTAEETVREAVGGMMAEVTMEAVLESDAWDA
jgi:hypothetical protein